MTIFHVIKYPLSDIWTPQRGIEGIAAIRIDLPDLYEIWVVDSWLQRDAGNLEPLTKNEDVSESINNLRRLLLEYEGPI